jgi:DNA-binding NarL/FixJ family response regulator
METDHHKSGCSTRIIKGSPHSRVIILTGFGEEDKVFPAIRAGAEGYLLKDITPNDLVQAVGAFYLGQVQLHPEVARKLMSVVSGKGEFMGMEMVSAVLVWCRDRFNR